MVLQTSRSSVKISSIRINVLLFDVLLIIDIMMNLRTMCFNITVLIEQTFEL